MTSIHPQYLTDEAGKKISVVLSMADYEKLLDALEMLEDLRLYDEAKAQAEPSIPLEEAFAMIEAERKAE